MSGDSVRIGEEQRKINDLRSECIAAFTHRGRQAKYSSSSPSLCSILLQGKDLSRHACRPKGAYLFNNSAQLCFLDYDNSDSTQTLSPPSCLFPLLSSTTSLLAQILSTANPGSISLQHTRSCRTWVCVGTSTCSMN